ncbi:hypothetical protein ACFOET_15495 [Parapedobacter deserti]|uniref:DUF2383 domain-containing protein n=1 Tax=Parapedobacter deserti TaxID=1912957 RepID=A0ABV7JRX2_9SPHI
MENLKITEECLRDLVAFHAERIKGYETMLASLTPDEGHLVALFEAFIKQSAQMKGELLQSGVQWGLMEDEVPLDGQFGLAWSVVKTVFSSRMPSYSLAKCKSGENALLIAYHCVEGTDGLYPPMRSLVNKQKREVIAAREWITHFEGLGSPSVQQELAAVS